MLPNPNITPIPNTEPDAVPALWNTRYSEIDANFTALAVVTQTNSDELIAARGDDAQLSERLSAMDAALAQVDPEAVEALGAKVTLAIEQAAVANAGVTALRELVQQEGEVVLINRGVVTGCTCSRSATATRNLDLAAGVAFMKGRMYRALAATNAASVPPNTGSSAVTVQAYLYLHSSQQVRLAVTSAGQALPSNAIHLYNISIPAGSTDATDPQLANVTITSVIRSEPEFPRSLSSPPHQAVSIETLGAADYRVDLDVVSFAGGHCGAEQVQVTSRATNGFTLALASEVDNALVRWRISKLNN
ncbi:MAG: hypothetical protein ACRCYV_02510 [Aeromonas sp.]